MAEGPESRRLFNEKEISSILKRAAEIQGNAGAAEAAGLSLAELRQIATEVGIEPRFVEAAAAELEQAPVAATPNRLLGGPLSVEVERVVEGAVTDEQWEDMVTAISRSFGTVGVTGQRGRVREWTYQGRRQQAQVTVTHIDGRTRIRVFSQFARSAAIFHAPLTVVGFILAFNVLLALGALSPLGVTVFIATLAAMHLIARFSFAAFAHRKERQAQQLLHRLDEIAAAKPAPAQSVEASAPMQEGSLLDPTPVPDAPEEPAAQRERRLRT